MAASGPLAREGSSKIGNSGVFATLAALLVASGVGIGWLLPGSQPTVPARVDEAAAGASMQQSTRMLSRDALFVPPENMDEFIKKTKKATVTIHCNGGTGAGWIIDTPVQPVLRPKMQSDYGDEFTQIVVTAEHVIADCRRKDLDVGVLVGGSYVPAVLINWDKIHDIATIGIKSSRGGAPAVASTPEGTWAMTVGAPIDKYLVPTIGQVIRNDGFHVLLHMTSQPGNSGGPIFNSRGEVVATLGGTILDEESQSPTGWSYSAPVNSLCERLFDCSWQGIDAK